MRTVTLGRMGGNTSITADPKSITAAEAKRARVRGHVAEREAGYIRIKVRWMTVEVGEPPVRNSTVIIIPIDNPEGAMGQ